VGRSGGELLTGPGSVLPVLVLLAMALEISPAQLLDLASRAATSQAKWAGGAGPAHGPPWAPPWPDAGAMLAAWPCRWRGPAAVCCWWHPAPWGRLLLRAVWAWAGCGRHRSPPCCCCGFVLKPGVHHAGVPWPFSHTSGCWAGCCWMPAKTPLDQPGSGGGRSGPLKLPRAVVPRLALALRRFSGLGPLLTCALRRLPGRL